jgi:hypothetical protein
MWARLFNRSGHEIAVLQEGVNKVVTIPPGGNATINLWGAAMGNQRGFLIADGERKLFYALQTNTRAHREDKRLSSPLLPDASAIHRPGGLEFFLEYGGAFEISALAPTDDGNPRKIEPQPSGFPCGPNQLPEPTSPAFTPAAGAAGAPSVAVAH